MSRLFVIFLATMFMAGCNVTSQTGKLSVNITDAPVLDAQEVYLAVSGITLHGPDGEQSFSVSDDFEAYTQFPLMTLAGDTSASLFTDLELTAGRYQWIRLDLVTEGDLDTYVELTGGGVHELTLSSTTGLKLNRGFIVPVNGSLSFTLDVDLQKSLVLDEGIYKLKPVIRIVDDSEIGHIHGTVDGALCSGDPASVYLMAGADAEPVDISPEAEPEIVAPVEEGSFKIGFVVAGNYTLALACAPEDDSTVVDDLNFVQQQNVVVEVNRTIPVSF